MKVERSCGAIIKNDGKILVIKQNTGFYGFPKGHMDAGETEIETAIREVKEETNVDIEITSDKKYEISYPKGEDVLKEVVYFLAKPVGDISVKNQEAEVAEVLWVNKEEVADLLTFDNLKELYLKTLSDK